MARRSAALAADPCVGRTLPGRTMTTIVALLALGGTAAPAAAWPKVTPVAREFVVADGRHARLDIPIAGPHGAVLYRLLCRTWLSAEDDSGDFDYSGDFECRLISASPSGWRDGWNLLADEARPTRDWHHRGRFLWQELTTTCLTYPGYGAERTFHLRGMTLVLSLSNWTLEPPPPGAAPVLPAISRFLFRVSVDPEPSISNAYARAVTYDQPCCLPATGVTCDALDCAQPKRKGSLCPGVPRSGVRERAVEQALEADGASRRPPH